jgi:hypothetical protein
MFVLLEFVEGFKLIGSAPAPPQPTNSRLEIAKIRIDISASDAFLRGGLLPGLLLGNCINYYSF